MPRSLAEYQRKRDFSKTPEPKGAPDPSAGNRFVVQKHWAHRLHYDFRLEMEGVLVSWAIPKGPTLNPAEKRLAAHVEDHPVSYYDFEGTIPKGEYGGGTVMVWDWGTYELEESTPAESLRRGEVKFRLNGIRLRGRYALVRTRSDKDWLLIKKKDEAADPSFDIQHFDTSVKTGRTKEEIEQGQDAVWSSRRDAGGGGLINLANAEKGPMPRTLEPMKAQLVDAAFDDDRWLFEVKWDGIRLVSFIDNGKVSLQKRPGRSVDKLRDSPYQPGMRSSAWLKIKAVRQQEVVIGGFTEPRGGRRHFGALIVGVYEDGKFVYAGHVGGGFDERSLESLAKLMKPLIVKTSPFSGEPPRGNEKPTWVRPKLVAEVKFAEWTRDGVMRQPVFLGLRDDVDPREVRRELPHDADREMAHAKPT